MSGPGNRKGWRRGLGRNETGSGGPDGPASGPPWRRRSCERCRGRTLPFPTVGSEGVSQGFRARGLGDLLLSGPDRLVLRPKLSRDQVP